VEPAAPPPGPSAQSGINVHPPCRRFRPALRRRRRRRFRRLSAAGAEGASDGSVEDRRKLASACLRVLSSRCGWTGEAEVRCSRSVSSRSCRPAAAPPLPRPAPPRAAATVNGSPIPGEPRPGSSWTGCGSDRRRAARPRWRRRTVPKQARAVLDTLIEFGLVRVVPGARLVVSEAEVLAATNFSRRHAQSALARRLNDRLFGRDAQRSSESRQAAPPARRATGRVGRRARQPRLGSTAQGRFDQRVEHRPGLLGDVRGATLARRSPPIRAASGPARPGRGSPGWVSRSPLPRRRGGAGAGGGARRQACTSAKRQSASSAPRPPRSNRTATRGPGGMPR